MNGKDVGELAKEASKKKKSSSLVAEAQTETHADGLHTHSFTEGTVDWRLSEWRLATTSLQLAREGKFANARQSDRQANRQSSSTIAGRIGLDCCCS